jgi:hypothetical protein
MEEQHLKRGLLLAGAMAAALGMAGCNTPQGQNAANGAVLGGATGALIGGLASGRPGGALAGAALGAGTGAIIGAAATPPPPPPGYYGPPPRCARRAFDEYGNPVCLRYYGY